MKRKTIVAGNWKMHKTLDEVLAFAKAYQTQQPVLPEHVEVWIAPSMPYLPVLSHEFQNAQVCIGVQDISIHDQGAYTGETAGAMVATCGGSFTLVGHSERRQYHNETDLLIGQKMQAALRHNLVAVYCCGEHLQDREAGRHFDVVKAQLEEAFTGFGAAALSRVVVAYEPVWAIGTGVTASTEQAGEMHRFIRSWFQDQFGETVAGTLCILYGGSVKPSNAGELFADPDIDGALIGGASLVASDFLSIIQAAC